MTKFFMRKFIMIVMLALFSLRLFEVQANDLPPTLVTHLF